MVKDLKDRGCGITGVGFQLHETVDFNQYIQGVKDNMHRYNQIGITVHMTEITVKCR